MSGPEVERKKKDVIRIFKSNGLSITFKTNLKVADFLDIYFEITQDNIYFHTRKLGEITIISAVLNTIMY